MKPIILGMGCVCSLGGNPAQIAKNLFSLNADASFPTDRFSSSYFNQYPVFQAPKDLLLKKQKDESYSFLFLRTAMAQAFENAGLNPDDLKTVRAGVCIGTTVDVSFNCFDFYKSWKQNKNLSLEPLNKYIGYSTAKKVIENLNLSNAFAQTVVTACASGTDAIGIAGQWIENGLCDVAICGGCDELNLIPYTGFIKLMIASRQPCKPFDKNRNGINLGEAAGVFIMTSEKFARQRNLKSIGTLLGYGNGADAYHATSPEPNGRGLSKALLSAMNEAALTSRDIAFINAHATGTKDNDAAEAKVFNSLLSGVPVCATKGLTGHTLGAAGAVEACLSLICLNEGKIPKTKNFQTPDETLGLCPVDKETLTDKTKAAISTSLAFGGCNAAIILKGCQQAADE
ncbi:MAG: beta-ketoacyl-[acyl-carrier-protein] synthase family protein [Endomicrobium sp.]|jgi:3-oxoacyl-(acyl-carrier-protein) synthase|nr:beta-ketoacyl-[acyl-carrier-protein] synthase family protein [Endomicrobium sp.]